METHLSTLVRSDFDGGALNDTIKDKQQSLNCGVVVRDGFSGDINHEDELVGMSVDYCRALNAALFWGDSDSVNVTPYSMDDGFLALNNSLIDVLAGAKVELKYDFANENENPKLRLQGFDFSTGYFFGNESIV